MAKSLKNPGGTGIGQVAPNTLLPHQISGWRAIGHQGLATTAGTLAEAATAEGCVPEPEGTGQHFFSGGYMPGLGCTLLSGYPHSHTHISCHLHPPPDLTITNPLFISGFLLVLTSEKWNHMF